MARLGFAFCFLVFLPVSVEARSHIDVPSELVISLPGLPNAPEQHHYAGRLLRGTWHRGDEKGVPVEVDPVRALTEAALRCGQRRLRWRGLNSDHGNEMLIANDHIGQRTLACIAGKVSFDFYARVDPIEVR